MTKREPLRQWYHHPDLPPAPRTTVVKSIGGAWAVVPRGGWFVSAVYDTWTEAMEEATR